MNNRSQENGRILIMVLVIILTLSAFWFIALSSVGTELQLTGGRKSATRQLYAVEAGATSLMEAFGNYSSDLNTNLTTDLVMRFLVDPEANLAAIPINSADLDPSSNLIDPVLVTAAINADLKLPALPIMPTAEPDWLLARMVCRPILDDTTAPYSNYNLPEQNHEFTPPAGSGSGVNTAVSKRYGLNVVSGRKEIQVGIYRTVPQ